MARKRIKPSTKPFPIGLRVKHVFDKRSGFIVGRPEPNGIKSCLYPVTIEGSTRTELWPEHLIRSKPVTEQFPVHGGTFSALPGYPLNVHDK